VSSRRIVFSHKVPLFLIYNICYAKGGSARRYRLTRRLLLR